MTIECFEAPGGVKLRYRLDSFTDPGIDPPTIVLAHGFTRNSNMWYAWVPALAQQFRVVRVDLRGHGLSKVPLTHISKPLDTLVLDALALLDHLSVNSAVWVGEATGGIVGLALGARLPDRLRCLIGMTIPLATGASHLTEVLEAGLNSNERVLGKEGDEYMLTHGMKAWAERSIRTRPWPREANSEYRQWWVNEIAQNDPQSCYDFHRPMENLDQRPLFKALQVPMLYLDGSRNSILTQADRNTIQENPHIRVATIDGPGIDICYARPRQCLEEVGRFLSETGAVGSLGSRGVGN